MAYQLSTQQIAVLDWVKNGEGSLNLIARAGTGKTSTLMEIAKVIEGYGFMGSFNKAIADEFKMRLLKQGSAHVTGATLHSAGIGAWRKVAPKVQVDGNKMKGIVKGIVAWDNKLVKAICDTVSFGKQMILGVDGNPFDSPEPWQGIVDYYDVQEEIPGGTSVEQFVGYCMKAYKQSLDSCQDVVDFDDMLLAPLYFKANIKKYDWVLIDEAQDTNKARRMLSFEMMRPGSRMVACGDPAQAIYGFAGANSDSMDLIAQEMSRRGKFTELPLSVTYRCPKRVVDEANAFVPDIEAHENNIEGTLTIIDHRQLWEQSFSGKDVLLCRNTRPLVGIASRLRDKGVACIVEGMSGKGLITLAEKWGEDISLESFREYLDAYEESEIAKWTAKGSPEKCSYVVDRCGTLRDLCRGLRQGATTANLVGRINLLFSVDSNQDRSQVLTLCTVHRSKGREWDRVFIVGRNRYMPSPFAKADWEIQQEGNLAYVAITRSKRELVDVMVPVKRRDETEWWER